MYTLNETIKLLTDVADGHDQIAARGVGDIAEWSPTERSYPLLWIVPIDTETEDGKLGRTFRVGCFDRVLKGEEGQDNQYHEQEVLSDMELVLLDFVAYFVQQDQEGFFTTRIANLVSATEQLDDRLAGYFVELTIYHDWDFNKCQIPATIGSPASSVDGITLNDFCDDSVFNRLTDAQKTCLIAQLCGDADPATLEINGTEIADIPSGDTRDQEVHNTDGTDVGSNNSGEWVVGDSTLRINGTPVIGIPATETRDQPVHDDEGQDIGSLSGTDWVVADATVQDNVTPTWSYGIQPEDTYTLPQGKMLDSDGSTTVLADYKPSANGFMFTATPAASVPSVVLTVYEDAGFVTPITEAKFGDTVYVKAVASNITPTEYVFSACNTYESKPIYMGANDNTSWVVGLADTLEFEVRTTDGVNTTADTYSVDVDGFITEWTTWLNGSSNDDQIIIPTQSTGSYNCAVDWGDGSTDSITTWNDAAWTHTYASEGTYYVTITGTFDGFSFNNGGDKLKLRKVIKWGPCGLTVPSAGRVFMGCTNLEAIIGNDAPTCYANSMKDFIRNCSKLYEFRMNGWITSAVTALTGFAYTANTAKIEGFEDNDWSNVGNMVNGLRTYSKDMELQNMSVASITNGTNFLNSGEISRANYDATLIAWEASAPPTGITFHFGNSKYTLGGAAETARTSLITTYSWNISDGGGV